MAVKSNREYSSPMGSGSALPVGVAKFAMPVGAASVVTAATGAGAAASALTFRPAQFSDLEAIVGVIVAAMPSDPQWDWRFPRRREYADDTRAFTSAKYHEFLSDKDAWHVMVAESDDSARPHVCRARMIVAVAVWDVTNANALHRRHGVPELETSTCAMQCPPSEPLLLPSHKRRDGHRRRMELWAATMAKARKQYFDDSFGARHLQLQILATHPDYQRRGAGTALCKWGMAFAQKWGMVVTVFASPMGKKLYRRLGFQTMARIEMRVPDEMESVAPVAMSYEPHGGIVWAIAVREWELESLLQASAGKALG